MRAAAARGAARASLPRRRRLRDEEHADRAGPATGSSTSRSRTTATRSSTRLLPLVRRALGDPLARAVAPRCATVAAGFLARYEEVAGERAARRPRRRDRAHGLPPARAHRRQVAGRVPRSAVGAPSGAGCGPRVAPHAGAGAVAVDLIERVFAWEALDSRGTPTVACAVRARERGGGRGDRALGRVDRHARGARAPRRRRALRRQGRRAARSRRSAPRSRPTLVGRDVNDLAAIDAATARARRHAEPRAARRQRRAGRVGRVRDRGGCHARRCRSGVRSATAGRRCCRCRW